MQELPAEMMAPPSNNQASGGYLAVTREEDLEPPQMIPVKILHQKGPTSRKKGLSLVNYPKSFT